MNSRDLSATAPQPVVSIKHTMSRVKAGAATGGGGAAAAASAGEARVTDGGRLKAAIRASIESRTSSNEGVGDLDDDEEDDDDDDDDDLDSPRNRGRQYDDRWKMPGHAESVLASFVERLEHRGHAVDGEGVGSGGGGGGVFSEMSAAAALEEARASRGVAVAVLGRSHRLQTERTARNSPGPSAALAESGKRRKSAGGSKSGVKSAAGSGAGGGKNGTKHGTGTGVGTGTGGRSRGKGGKTSSPVRRASGGKGRRAAPANAAGHKPSSVGIGGAASAASAGNDNPAVGGAWSKIASSFQRAAEAIVGVSKEAGEEEQQHRTEIDRTRNAVTAFLSTNRREDRDKEADRTRNAVTAFLSPSRADDKE